MYNMEPFNSARSNLKASSGSSNGDGWLIAALIHACSAVVESYEGITNERIKLFSLETARRVSSWSEYSWRESRSSLGPKATERLFLRKMDFIRRSNHSDRRAKRDLRAPHGSIGWSKECVVVQVPGGFRTSLKRVPEKKAQFGWSGCRRHAPTRLGNLNGKVETDEKRKKSWRKKIRTQK